MEAPYPSCSNQVSCILFYHLISLNQLWPSPRVMAQLLNDVSICFAEGFLGPAESRHRCDWPTGASFGEVRSVRWNMWKYMCNIDTNATTEDTTQSPSKNPWIYKSYKDSPAPPKIISTIIIRSMPNTSDSWSWVRQKSQWFGWQCSYCNALEHQNIMFFFCSNRKKLLKQASNSGLSP